MEALSHLLARARDRVAQQQFSYAGALTPTEAHEVLKLAPHAKLIDVRSRAELDLVGRIPEALHIEWAFYPGMVANPDFANQLKMQVDAEHLMIFMCRTGGRSHQAALLAAQLGFTEVYNMLEGFEGESTVDTRQRCQINGWRHANLPWTNA